MTQTPKLIELVMTIQTSQMTLYTIWIGLTKFAALFWLDVCINTLSMLLEDWGCVELPFFLSIQSY